LNNLININGSLEIFNNVDLTSLSGLEGVVAIEGTLRIDDNANLSNINGLSNIDMSSVNILYLRDNPLLSACAVQSICNYVENSIGSVTISGNAIGCANKQELELACETINVPENNPESGISIYPNPAQKEIFISGFNKNGILEVNIYNQIGQRVWQEKQKTNQIDVSTLQQGLYFVEVVTNKSKIRQKMLIR
jgi:hypothetical protein